MSREERIRQLNEEYVKASLAGDVRGIVGPVSSSLSLAFSAGTIAEKKSVEE
jgi:hypothetical protein